MDNDGSIKHGMLFLETDLLVFVIFKTLLLFFAKIYNLKHIDCFPNKK